MIAALRLIALLILCGGLSLPSGQAIAETPEEVAPAEEALPAQDATPRLPAPAPAPPPPSPPAAGPPPTASPAVEGPPSQEKKRKKKKKKKPGAQKAKKKRHKAKQASASLPIVHARIGRTWMFLAPLRSSLGVGYLDGYGVLAERGGFTRIAVGATPTLRWRRGAFLLALPLFASYELPIDQALTRSSLAAGIDVRGRLGGGFSARATAGIRAVAWPDRPDPYQPILDDVGDPTGALGGTDRYGYTGLDAGLELAWRGASDGPELALEADFDRRTYIRDPDFDLVLTPTHLVPGDRDRYRVAATLRGKVDLWRYRFGVSYAALDYGLAFARDAGTGLTHAAPGGAPANPLTHFDRVAATHRSSFWIAPLQLRAALELGYTHNVDAFAGYYTWDEVRVAPSLRLRPGAGWVAELDYAFAWRGYAATGYQEGAGHPALDDGASRRTLTTHELAASLTRELAPGLSLRVGVRWRRADTTFPDYVPWVYPAGAAYAIDFDYADLRAEVGLSLEL